MADGPRQTINALTLYSIFLAKKNAGEWWDIPKYFKGNSLSTSALTVTTFFTFVIFAGSALLLIIAGVCYIPLLCYIQGNLKVCTYYPTPCIHTDLVPRNTFATKLISVLPKSSSVGTKSVSPKQLPSPRKKPWAITPILRTRRESSSPNHSLNRPYPTSPSTTTWTMPRPCVLVVRLLAHTPRNTMTTRASTIRITRPCLHTARINLTVTRGITINPTRLSWRMITRDTICMRMTTGARLISLYRLRHLLSRRLREREARSYQIHMGVRG